MPYWLARLTRPALLAVVGLAAALVAGIALAADPGREPAPAVADAPVPDRSHVSLAGRTVVLDPGHNGGNASAPDAIHRLVDAGGMRKECDTVGSETENGYPEHAFTYDVAGRVAAVLRARGAVVVLTRRDDRGVGPCIDRRARIGNDAHADAVVSIHADGGPATGRGFHVIEPAVSPDGANQPIITPSARLAEDLRAAFGQATGEPRADYVGEAGLSTRADLGGLNLSRVPKVFVECANMRNPTDAALVTDPGWRQRAATGIADGIIDFLAADGGDAGH
jgi:N-acetylmuramoyl-L-alanine amidase